MKSSQAGDSAGHGNRRAFTEMVKAVLSVIDEDDPMGLRSMGAPPDEYDAEAHAVMQGLRACESSEQCSDLVWRVFNERFGPSAGPRERYIALSERIWATVSGR